MAQNCVYAKSYAGLPFMPKSTQDFCTLNLIAISGSFTCESKRPDACVRLWVQAEPKARHRQSAGFDNVLTAIRLALQKRYLTSTTMQRP